MALYFIKNVIILMILLFCRKQKYKIFWGDISVKYGMEINIKKIMILFAFLWLRKKYVSKKNDNTINSTNSYGQS